MTRLRPSARAPLGLPVWIYLPALIGGAFVIAPLAAMLATVQWSQFWELVTSESSVAALKLSLKTAAMSTLLCILFGVPMAAVLARSHFRGLSVLRSLILLPLVLPPVVGGIALLYTFGRKGLIGEQLEVLGIQIAFSTTAVVLAQTFVALPFLVVSLEGALRTAGTRYEAVASTLGARPDHRASPGDFAAGASRSGVRGSAGFRSRTGGVRCNADVRGKSARGHAYPAVGNLSPA